MINAAAGEACDDANDVDTDACTNACQLSSCNNGILNQDESAVDCGGSRAPCAAGQACNATTDCATGLCDGANTCVSAASCLELLTLDPALPDGEYLIDRDAEGPIAPVQVYCDMTSDGGGYTFLKLNPNAGQPIGAPEAEAICAEYGMQLHITRSPAHARSSVYVTFNEDIGPDGSPQYIYILGIYPDFDGATCANQPLNSDNPTCEWSASDGGPFWVSDRTDIIEPNGDNTTTGSMNYSWGENGATGYNDILEGHEAERIICQVGDKVP